MAFVTYGKCHQCGKSSQLLNGYICDPCQIENQKEYLKKCANDISRQIHERLPDYDYSNDELVSAISYILAAELIKIRNDIKPKVY
jgi:hypothetical protein